MLLGVSSIAYRMFRSAVSSCCTAFMHGSPPIVWSNSSSPEEGSLLCCIFSLLFRIRPCVMHIFLCVFVMPKGNGNFRQRKALYVFSRVSHVTVIDNCALPGHLSDSVFSTLCLNFCINIVFPILMVKSLVTIFVLVMHFSIFCRS